MPAEQKEIKTSHFYPEGGIPKVWVESLKYFGELPPTLSRGFIEVEEVSFRGLLDQQGEEVENVQGVAVHTVHPDGEMEKILYLQIGPEGYIQEEGLLMEKWKTEGGANLAFSVINARGLLATKVSLNGFGAWESLIDFSWNGHGVLGDGLTNSAFGQVAKRMISSWEAEDILAEWFLISFPEQVRIG